MHLFPKQKWSIRRANARINIWDGSVRAGKTVSINNKFLTAIGESKKYLPPDAVDIMVGKTIGSLKRNIINPICDLLGNDAQYFPGKQEFHIWNNIIYTIGANDERAVGKIQGATARKVLGDELTLWPESFFKMMDSRLSLDVSQLFGSTNPGPPGHYLKKEYLNRKGELDLNSFHFVIDDNTSLSPRYVEAIKKNYVGLWYKRYILGLWCAAEGAIFDFFNEDEHTITSWPEAEYYILAVDYGTANPFAALLMGVNHMALPRIWAEREYWWDSKAKQRQKTDSEYSQDLKDFLKENLGPGWREVVRTIYLDPSAESFEVQLGRDGFSGVCHADNTVDDGLRTVATMLKNRNYAISVHCPHYIEEMYGYVWDEKKQEKGEDQPKKVRDHCQDAGRYGVHSEFGNNYLDLGLLTRMI
ncbi:PBSX family phage terminase large subunit [Candidatus Pacearchaeota archaeon]|nr:PBSX family phage terminase large subunit [Candidatus Pacearchaeota archaeon]